MPGILFLYYIPPFIIYQMIIRIAIRAGLCTYVSLGDGLLFAFIVDGELVYKLQDTLPYFLPCVFL